MRHYLVSAPFLYRVNHENCSNAIYALASVLLLAIFKDNQVVSYEDTIKRHPWLVKMLVNAYSNGMATFDELVCCSS